MGREGLFWAMDDIFVSTGTNGRSAKNVARDKHSFYLRVGRFYAGRAIFSHI